MDKSEVFDCSNVFIAAYFVDNTKCVHRNDAHTLIYLYSGGLEIIDNGHKTVLEPGQCAFMRRDNNMILNKSVRNGEPYRSVVLRFSRDFLREFYKTLNKREIPVDAKRDKSSLYVFPKNRVDIQSLFQSVLPYFETETKPSEEILKLKMIEGVYAILNTDESLYASLFDFVDPWKIDILDFMEKNYTNDLTMQEMASYTGRSLSTFKRDFRRYSDLTPEKWLIQRRLKAAHDLIEKGTTRKISDICYDVGFKNLSHFSKAYKAYYGSAPTMN